MDESGKLPNLICSTLEAGKWCLEAYKIAEMGGEKGKCVDFVLIPASNIFGGCRETLMPVSSSIPYVAVWRLKIRQQQLGFGEPGLHSSY